MIREMWERLLRKYKPLYQDIVVRAIVRKEFVDYETSLPVPSTITCMCNQFQHNHLVHKGRPDKSLLDPAVRENHIRRAAIQAVEDEGFQILELRSALPRGNGYQFTFRVKK